MAVAAIHNARASFLLGDAALAASVFSEHPAPLLAAYEDASRSGDEALAVAYSMLLELGDSELASALDELLAVRARVQQGIDRYLQAIDQPTPADSLTLARAFEREIWPSGAELIAEWETLVGQAQAGLAADRDAANDAAQLDSAVIVGYAALAFLLGVGALLSQVVSVLRPLALLQSGVRSLMSGDMRSRVSETGPQEISRLAHDFNKMTEALQERTLRLETSESRFRNVLEVSSDLVYKFNVQAGEFEYVSPASLPITGFTPEEFAGLGARGTRRRVHPDDWEKYRVNLDELVELGAGQLRSERAVFRWLHRDGDYRWFSESRAIIRDENNEPLAIVGTARDVTAWITNEEALRASDQRFRSLASCAPIAISLLNAEGECEYVNDRWVAISGLCHEESLGQGWANVIHPDDRRRVLRAGRDAMRTGSGFEEQFRIVTPERLERWIHSLTTPLTDEGGNVVGHVGMSMDVTDSRQAEERKRLAYENVVLLLATAAEARDPYTEHHLQRIKGYAEAIAAELALDDELVAAIGQASLLHDIGKMRVPDHILTKPGPLSLQEWQIMRRHTSWGAELLSGHPWLDTARQIARHHHENWDGSGYPDGLAGEQIPLSAAIVAVADGFDAMTSDRPYKSAWPPTRATKEICSQRGIRYSPMVVDAFLRALRKGKIAAVMGVASAPKPLDETEAA